jgi:hypothetical protein
MAKKFLPFMMVILLSKAMYAYDMKNVYAYPVPFNPVKHNTIKINNPSGDSLKMTVYDVNGDIVTEKSGSGTVFHWNGRNNSGRLVKPGLYIIKVEIENSSGDYGKKIIRILVDY